MKNKIAILFYTKSSRALKNGLLPIYLRITIDGIRVEVSTSKYVEKSKWSALCALLKRFAQKAQPA